MLLRDHVALAAVITGLLPGAAAQLSPPDMLARPCDVDATVTGLAGDHIGVTLDARGDLDGDGRGDILIPTMRAFDSGGVCPTVPQNVVRVVSLDSQGVPHQLLESVDVGEQSRQSITVAWIGDINGGGRDDFALGVPAWPIDP
jgi:hypothetical protein